MEKASCTIYTNSDLMSKKKDIYWGRYRTTTYDWYLKWVASVIILAAMSIRGVPDLTQLDLTLSLIGVFLWLLVSLIWKDRALILLNGVGLLFLAKTYVQMYLI